MGLVAEPIYSMGGVDTRSNPINRPLDRALKCENWVPTEAGYLQLRNGYGEVTQSAVTATAIHSLCDFKLWDGTRYLIYVQGTSLKRVAMATGTVTTIGTLSNSNPCYFERSDNKLFIANGTDFRFYDGTTLRHVGIRAATAADVANVTVLEVLRGPTSAEAGAVTVTPTGAGGTFSATTKSGVQFYMHYFDLAANDGWSFGPGYEIEGRQTIAANNQIDLAVLPDLTGIGWSASWVKLISRTDDGTGIAKFCSTDSKSITNLSFNTSTWTMTATATAHGFAADDVVEIAVTGWEGVFRVASAPTADTFTYVDLVHRNGAGSTGPVSGTAYKLFKVAKATTTGSILSPSTGALTANAECGLAESTVDGPTPGYKVAACIYNPTTGAVGNKMDIKGTGTDGRFYHTGYRAIYYIQVMTDLSGTDPEFRWLFGRSGDGATVPYAIADSALNWQYIDNARTFFVLRESGIDGAAELPTTNDKPSGIKFIQRVGSRMYGVKASSPYVYFTPDKGDKSFVGVTEQSWFADSYDTFPTGDPIDCIVEADYELVALTENDAAIFTEASGVFGWRGPWNISVAGARAVTKTPYGFYWVTRDKRLARQSQEGPVPVSGEYELGTLSRIGDAYIADVEIEHLVDAELGIDRLYINCKDDDGAPFMVVHDFNLRDGRSPEGQGYVFRYEGALATAFTMKKVRDENGKQRIWCGASNGRIYELETADNDNATEFDAEYIVLANLGEKLISNPWEQWYGDANLEIHHGKELNTTLENLQSGSLKLNQGGLQGGQNSFKHAVTRGADGVENPQYFRLLLTSHSADVPAESEVPQLPVNDYGRVYGVKMALADVRGE